MIQLPLTSSKHPSNHPDDNPSSPYQLTGSFPRAHSHIPETPTLIWHSYSKWPFKVDFPIKNGDFSKSKLLVYQRVQKNFFILFYDKHPSDFCSFNPTWVKGKPHSSNVLSGLRRVGQGCLEHDCARGDVSQCHQKEWRFRDKLVYIYILYVQIYIYYVYNNYIYMYVRIIVYRNII